jgi:hypothetical protein
MLSFEPSHDVADGLNEALSWYVERASIIHPHQVSTSRHRPIADAADLADFARQSPALAQQ